MSGLDLSWRETEGVGLDGWRLEWWELLLADSVPGRLGKSWLEFVAYRSPSIPGPAQPPRPWHIVQAEGISGRTLVAPPDPLSPRIWSKAFEGSVYGTRRSGS